MDRVIMSRASEWVFESLKGWHRRGFRLGVRWRRYWTGDQNLSVHGEDTCWAVWQFHVLGCDKGAFVNALDEHSLQCNRRAVRGHGDNWTRRSSAKVISMVWKGQHRQSTVHAVRLERSRGVP